MKDSPAVVGELVAEMRSESQGGAFFVPGVTVDKWADRLSALTAEAGKGEVTDAMVEAGCLAVVTVSGFKPENWPHTYPDAGQLRKAVRAALEAALSTATPAGEWREIDPFLDEAINGAVSDLDMIAAGVDPVTGDKLTHAAVQAIARASAITLNEAWTLAASPRGAVEAK